MKTRRNKCVQILCSILMLLALAVYAPAQTPSAAAGQQKPAVSGDQAHSIIGEWQAAVGRQRLIVKIEQPDGSPLKATLTVPDQGNASIPFDSAAVDQNGTLNLGLKAAGSSYEGKLSADGTEINGTWKQGGSSIPVVFRRPGASTSKFTLQPRTQGRIALQPCRTDDGNVEGLCGKYEVYENRQSRQGRKIALNVMLLPATAAKPEPDPFFAFAGGPGQSATQAFPLAGFVTKVRARRDVVLVDQRGTGKSNLLECSLQDIHDAQTVLGEPYSLDKIRQCRAETDSKADPAQYTTSIAADDVDEVREALGYNKINVFGGSYGSKAALVYLRLHGDHVRTLALEAVASPEYLLPLPFAKALQSSIDGVIALCAADAACHKDYPDLAAEFKAVVERLEKTPAHFQIRNQPVTLSREMFVSKLRSLLYFPQFVSGFPFMIHRAYANDWAPYGNTVMGIAGALEGSVARGTSFAVACAEDVPGLTESMIRRDTRGTYLGDSQVRRYQKYCEAWGKAGIVPKTFYTPVRSRVPTLLISGALDPATPPETARQAAHDLSNNTLVVVKQGTHGTGSACIDGLISQFVEQGSASGLDASCADQIHFPPFVTQTAVNQGSGTSDAKAEKPK